ncbi:MAG: hypothetical protein ACI8RD_008415, partial [Bacillariaceae sp.]
MQWKQNRRRSVLETKDIYIYIYICVCVCVFTTLGDVKYFLPNLERELCHMYAFLYFVVSLC